jgi:hypothetical protein
MTSTPSPRVASTASHHNDTSSHSDLAWPDTQARGGRRRGGKVCSPGILNTPKHTLLRREAEKFAGQLKSYLRYEKSV